MLHKEILTPEQIKLLPLIRKFKRSFFLVGGTSLALQIGHRRTIDFDLFDKSKINRKILEDRIRKKGFRFKKKLFEKLIKYLKKVLTKNYSECSLLISMTLIMMRKLNIWLMSLQKTR